MAKKDDSGTQDETQQQIQQLHNAAASDDVESIEQLRSEGVPVDARDSHGRIALMFAGENGHADASQRLLDHGADVNAVDDDGETASHKAAYGDHIDVLRVFHSRGADWNIRNKDGLTTWDIANATGGNAVKEFRAADHTGSSVPTNADIIENSDNDWPTTPGPAGPGAAASVGAAMAAAPEPSYYLQELDAESIPEMAKSPHLEKWASAPLQDDEARPEAESPTAGEQVERAWGAIRDGHEIALGLKTESKPAPSESILTANEERIVFDALDNKQVRSINEKVIKVLDKAGFEVGDFVIDTVFKGNYIAVLKPRSQENKRWRKLKKHPDWVIDPKRLTELTGGCAVRRLCLAEGKDVSHLTVSHCIELFYAKDPKLILTLAEEAMTNNYTVRQLKRAVEELREHRDDHDPGKEIIKTLDQPVPILEDPDLMNLCTDKDRVLEELSKAERKKIRALIKERKPHLDEWKSLMDTFEGILSDLEEQ